MSRFAATAIVGLVLLQAGCHTPATPPATAQKSKAPHMDAQPGDEPAAEEKPDGEAKSGPKSDAKKKAKAKTKKSAAPGDAYRRAAYDTAVWSKPPADVAAVYDAFVAASKTTDANANVVLDAGLSRVAAKLAVDPTKPTKIDPNVLQLAHEAGTPYRPAVIVRVDGVAATTEWAKQAAASLPGTSPLVIGVGVDARRSAERLVVLSRKSFDLVGKVPRRQAHQVRVVLAPAERARTPRLLVVGESGIERIDGSRSGDIWTFERPTLDRTLAAVLTYDPPKEASNDPFKTFRSQVGVMQSAIPPALPGDDAPNLQEAFAALRRAWHRPALKVDDAYVPPCGDKIDKMAGAIVTQKQECVSWPSGGSDGQRWAAMRLNPILYDILEGEDWDALQIRRENDVTVMRLGHLFEDVTVDQARARVKTELARRFPGAKPDLAADALATAQAQRWAAKQDPIASIKDALEATKIESAKWAKEKFLDAWLSSQEDVDDLLTSMDPGATPAKYGFGVARGVGARGEPRYYVVIFFSKP